jgi:hypothetical protein
MKLPKKAMKILSLAIAESAIEGEWRAASVRFISLLRSSEFKIEDFNPIAEGHLDNPARVSRLMPFGKHMGEPISEIPDGYLIWVSDNVILREPAKTWIAAELETRGL